MGILLVPSIIECRKGPEDLLWRDLPSQICVFSTVNVCSGTIEDLIIQIKVEDDGGFSFYFGGRGLDSVNLF